MTDVSLTLNKGASRSALRRNLPSKKAYGGLAQGFEQWDLSVDCRGILDNDHNQKLDHCETPKRRDDEQIVVLSCFDDFTTLGQRRVGFSKDGGVGGEIWRVYRG